MKASHYAEATHKALVGGMPIDRVLVRLRDVVRAHGHEPLYGQILLDLLRLLEKETRTRTATVTVAQGGAEKLWKDAIDAYISAEHIDARMVTVDPTIIGGYKISVGGKEVDATYKKSLLKIYQSLVA